MKKKCPRGPGPSRNNAPAAICRAWEFGHNRASVVSLIRVTAPAWQGGWLFNAKVLVGDSSTGLDS
jgi:hypothetical protein